ncbi:DUF636 domain-containing protein [Colletotrichum higginsianum IMI 349063]|uniref:DUF636 domain-containing protein n=3 Tax=Colletotrichum higginsianum TaxID=80884 RepID=A0A1B7Y302_COLHI|nr:DUF636 domain-containing protein [Colletotrichum higginsianum IMI 349063]OBR06392.1 DUF636 domain-containing protein [Colletotrichum higginsianum IMI 349063]TIC97442.1 hypothetical protein CH35J_007329 [Colletotrichum higginsianum]
MADSITIKAQCLCKEHMFSASLAESALPLRAVCCHCTSCRRVTGSLYSSCAPWPNPSEDLSGLDKYSYSRHTDIFFCGGCSSKLFCRVVSTLGPAVYVVTGALENTPGLVEYSSHMFVGDTVDGGASVWLPPAKRWNGGRGSQELSLESSPASKGLLSASPPAGARASPSATPFHCHCRGVHLSLRSAADLKADPAEVSTTSCINPQSLKFKASADSCDSCRLTFGSDVNAWAFAPLTHIGFDVAGNSSPGLPEFPRSLAALRGAVTATRNRDARLGTLAVYDSSPDVERYFCSRCAANVFYAVRDRDGMVDIAVGLLHHPNGARAEGLLAWSYGKVGWDVDAAGGWREGIVTSVKSLSSEWMTPVREGQHIG